MAPRHPGDWKDGERRKRYKHGVSGQTTALRTRPGVLRALAAKPPRQATPYRAQSAKSASPVVQGQGEPAGLDPLAKFLDGERPTGSPVLPCGLYPTTERRSESRSAAPARLSGERASHRTSES